jgi:hypothetical protein
LYPFAVLRKRFAAARLVFNLGMVAPSVASSHRRSGLEANRRQAAGHF